MSTAPTTIRAVILNKPPGYLSTRSHPGTTQKPTVYDCLPAGWDTQEHPLGHCGRLDKDSSGLLLFTDDGLLTQALLHPEFKHDELQGEPQHIDKLYHLCIEGDVSDAQLEELQTPITIGENRAKGGVETLPAKIERIDHDEPGTWLACTLVDGKNRQIRRLCKRSRLTLTTLRRGSFGPLTLDGLGEGDSRMLTQAEVDACYTLALPGLQSPELVVLG